MRTLRSRGLVAALALATLLSGLGGVLAARARGATASTATVEHRTFFSDVLQRTVGVTVLLPAGYTTNRRYPTLYFLHGGIGEGDPGFENGYISPEFGRFNMVGVIPSVGSPWMDPRRDPGHQVQWDLTSLATPDAPFGFFSYKRGSVSAPGVDYSVAVQAYETHFIKELIPWVQNNYSVRTDRGGRGITGHSGGS